MFANLESARPKVISVVLPEKNERPGRISPVAGGAVRSNDQWVAAENDAAARPAAVLYFFLPTKRGRLKKNF